MYLYDFYKKIRNKKSLELDVSEIEKLTQLILRLYIWGKYLFVENEYEINFGSDYYMSFLIGDSSNYEMFKKQIISSGLFIGRNVEENVI